MQLLIPLTSYQAIGVPVFDPAKPSVFWWASWCSEKIRCGGAVKLTLRTRLLHVVTTALTSGKVFETPAWARKMTVFLK
jgi:hypothetical protein